MMRMRRSRWLIAVAVALVGGLVLAGFAAGRAWAFPGFPGRGSGAQTPGTGPGTGGRYPNGAYGPGMMQGNGGSWGPGMMGGWGPGTRTNQSGQRLSGSQASQAVADYLATYYQGNSDLSVSEIMEFQNNFYAQVKEKSTDTSAFELLVDPYSGQVWPEYGPNMMWNTKYGHMAGQWGGAYGGMMGGYGPQSGGQGQALAPMTVSREDVVRRAQAYLDSQGTGLQAEQEPDTFYGYYTLHTLDKNGQIQGMLSVNGYTGQVWYHSWHGAFLGMVGEGQEL